MTKANSHIIQKELISIDFDDLDNSLRIQNRIAEFFYENLQPKMESLFDEMFGPGYFASVEKIEIDCGILSQKDWEEEWSNSVIRKLKNELMHVDKQKTGQTQAMDQFIFFLEHGYFPWNARLASIAALEQNLIIDSYLLTKLHQTIQDSGVVIKRLISQFTDNFLNQVVKAIIAYDKELRQKITSINGSKPEGKQKDYVKILEMFGKRPMTEKIQDNNKLLDKDKYDMIEKKKEKSKVDAEAIYINNAGLVVLHPFLPGLFELLQLTKDNQWADEEKQQAAALITEFLAKGEKESPEFNLPLNKILCGMDLDEAMKYNISGSEEWESACEELLMEVIRHWSVLKNTGINGLRETFLQRNGKLTKIDNGWLLQVEQKTMDILLGSLPWGIGTIKLPWMEEILYAEWC